MQEGDVEQVDVCICTYNRASLAETISSVALQDLPADICLRLVVADNNVIPLQERDTRALCERLGLAVTYVHAPARNIAIARNACLANVVGSWLVFIDDDEVARPGWLRDLLSRRHDSDVILGPVRAVYPGPATPRWMWRGDFHSTSILGNDPPDKGFTGNVLIRRTLVQSGSLRFSTALGQVGGEDTLFFRELYRRGARFAYVESASVLEEVAEARASLRWMLRRRYRMGQLHYALLDGRNRATSAAAAAKLFYCLLGAGLRILSPTAAIASLLRATFHAGVVAGALGARQVREYDSPPG